MKQAALALVLTLATATAAQAQKATKKKVTPPPATAETPVMQKDTPMASLPPLREMRPGLQAMANVRTDAATKTAMATVPHGTLQARTIEERGGRLIYAFRIRAADRKVHDVMVDATTGKIVPIPKPTPGKKG